MLDVGWSEILVIAIVLIIVVGPKDLPQMLRTFGRMMTKMRGMAGEFRQQFDEALREADLDDVRKTIGDAQKLNPLNSIRDAVNPLRQMGDEIKSDLQKATKSASTSSSSTPANPTVGTAATTGAAAQPVAVPDESAKPAPAEPVPAAPLKAGPVSATAGEAASKVVKPRKAASKRTGDAKPAKAAPRAARTTRKAAAANTGEAKAPAARKATRTRKGKDEA